MTMKYRSPLQFFPKAKNNYSEFRQVFWLAPDLCTFPPFKAVVIDSDTVYWAYSCGYSSGIAPDSLFISALRFENRNTEIRHKDKRIH